MSFDMGGTTAKAGLVLAGGQPTVLPGSSRSGRGHGSGAGVARGSGYPILAPVMDLVEIGAGGGSIAWIPRRRWILVARRTTQCRQRTPARHVTGAAGSLPTVH